MKILIIGNGSTGIHQDTQFFINNHTGNFLLKVSQLHHVTFAQNAIHYNPNNDLQNFELVSNKINFRIFKSNKSLFFLFRLISMICKNDFIYIFFPGTLGRIVGVLSILFMKKFGLYIRGQFFNQFKIDNYILKNTRFILTVSPHFIHSLTKYTRNINVIRPMISIKKKDIIYSRKYEKPEKWNLLFVGRVEYRKGINELIEIAKYFKKSKLSFVMNVVGGGELYNILEEKLNKLELSQHILLHGQVSNKQELMDFYLKANAFIFTSHDEGFPRVLYEAMASGLPVFTTFVGGIPGRMINGRNCIEIPVKNWLAASKIINSALKSQSLLKRIGINGQKTLLQILDGEYLTHEELLIKKIQEI